MKILMIVMGLVLANAGVSLACDKQAVELAQSFYNKSEQLLNSGTGSELDFNRAQKQLLDSQYCAEMYGKETYCANSILKQTQITQTVKNRYEIGMENSAIYSIELRELNRIKELCKGVRP